MVSVVQEQIRAIQSRKDELENDLSANGKPRKQLLSELNKRFDEAIEQFTQLRRYMEKAELAKLRQIFQEVIEKISIKVSKRKEGKRHRYTLLGGKIHLLGLGVSNSTS